MFRRNQQTPAGRHAKPLTRRERRKALREGRAINARVDNWIANDLAALETTLVPEEDR